MKIDKISGWIMFYNFVKLFVIACIFIWVVKVVIIPFVPQDKNRELVMPEIGMFYEHLHNQRMYNDYRHDSIMGVVDTMNYERLKRLLIQSP